MVKDKPNSIRTYDEDGFRKRAACLCVRNELEDEILLVTSSGDRDRWIVPGGGLEPNEDSSAAALREVMEEAGVIGHLARCLGSFEHPERRHRTSVYVLNVTEELKEWEDCGSRQRKWFKLDDAIAELSVHKPVQCKYVRLLSKNENQRASTNSPPAPENAQNQPKASVSGLLMSARNNIKTNSIVEDELGTR